MTRFLLIHLLIILLANVGNAQYLFSTEANNPNKGNSENSADLNPDFVIIGLPDTQYYSQNSQGSGSGSGSGDIAAFHSQTNWIVDKRDSANIVYVAHLGDCVNKANVENEWIRAEDAMNNLEDSVTTSLTDGIPYGIAVGNHDQYPASNPGIGSSTTVLYNQYFGVSRFENRGYYGGHRGEDNDNHFDLFKVGTLDFVVVYIEYNAHLDDPEALDWADSILAAYSDRHGILVSHKLLSSDGQFSDDADSIYSRVRDNANLFLMLCAHNTSTGEARWTESRGGDSTDVVTLMSNYQSEENGGNGWLRIMKFSPTDNKIYVKTYSPALDSLRTHSDSQFELYYSFADPPFPVELAFFTGNLNGDNIELRWRTETEVNNYGFNIERSKDDLEWLTIGFIEGHSNSNSPKYYNYTDFNIMQAGEYKYRLKQIDIDGTYEYSNIITVLKSIPDNFSLSQNYPNPFNPLTRIDFTVPEQQNVSLRVYNILGELVQELVNEVKPAGTYTVTFDGSDLPSGIYVYRIQTEGFAENKKMTLLK